MADKTTETRPWWIITRVEGLFIVAVGIGMLVHPLTNPHSCTVSAIGAVMVLCGTNAAISRQIVSEKPVIIAPVPVDMK